MGLKAKTNQEQTYKTQFARRKPGTWLRLQLIPGTVVQRFKTLPVLFYKGIFVPIATMCLLWFLFMIVRYPPRCVATLYVGLSGYRIGLWLFGVAVISLFHECGHVSALLHCGGTPGGLGISMYFLLPRGWSEVNDTWRLTRLDRLYVDFGGIYFQLLLTMTVYFLNVLWLDSRLLLTICVTSAQMALINLIPSAGSDGYWLVRDVFGIENISQKAKYVVRQSADDVQVGKLEKMKTISLLIIQNMTMIYLLIVIITVSSTAITKLLQETCSFVKGSADYSFSAVGSFLADNLSSIMIMAIVLQSAVTSIRQTLSAKKSPSTAGQ